MGSLLTSFLLAIGASAWVYSQVQRRNGGQAKQSVTVAAIAFVIFMIIAYPIMHAILG